MKVSQWGLWLLLHLAASPVLIPWDSAVLSTATLVGSALILVVVVSKCLWFRQVEGGGMPGALSQAFPAVPGCFSKDQVYLDGILRILRHRQTIDFPLLAALGKVIARVRVGQGVADPTIPSQSSHGFP